jgi:hypothetical protein
MGALALNGGGVGVLGFSDWTASSESDGFTTMVVLSRTLESKIIVFSSDIEFQSPFHLSEF